MRIGTVALGVHWLPRDSPHLEYCSWNEAAADRFVHSPTLMKKTTFAYARGYARESMFMNYWGERLSNRSRRNMYM
jgi:hypothetical protein